MELKFIWNWLYCCLFVIEYLTNKISEDEKQKYFCLIFHLREPHSWTHFLPTATVTNQSKSVEKHCRGRLNTAKLCNAVQHHHKRHPPRWSYSWKKKLPLTGRIPAINPYFMSFTIFSLCCRETAVILPRYSHQKHKTKQKPPPVTECV